MATLVLYVGNPSSEDANTIEKLYRMLETETLDPMFEKYGDFCTPAERAIVRSYNEEDPRVAVPLSETGSMHFHGNFFSYSCTFSVYTDDEDVIAKLVNLIKENKATLAYKQARDERKEHDAYWKKREQENRRLLRR